jgi:hypothetical protein
MSKSRSRDGPDSDYSTDQVGSWRGSRQVTTRAARPSIVLTGDEHETVDNINRLALCPDLLPYQTTCLLNKPPPMRAAEQPAKSLTSSTKLQHCSYVNITTTPTCSTAVLKSSRTPISTGNNSPTAFLSSRTAQTPKH